MTKLSPCKTQAILELTSYRGYAEGGNDAEKEEDRDRNNLFVHNNARALKPAESAIFPYNSKKDHQL